MTGALDKLIVALKDKNQTVVDDFNAKTLELAQTLRANLMTEADQKYDQQKHKIEVDASHLRANRLEAYKARSAQDILVYKFQLIDELLNDVETEFMNMDDESFRAYFSKHCYAARHIKIVKTVAKRERVISEIIKENQFDIEIVIDPAMTDGFVLIADDVDYNYEFDKLFAYHRNRLVEAARSGLFNE